MNKKHLYISAILLGLVLVGAGCEENSIPAEEPDKPQITRDQILNYCKKPFTLEEFKNNSGGYARTDECIEMLEASLLDPDGQEAGFNKLMTRKCDEFALKSQDPAAYKQTCYSQFDSTWAKAKPAVESAEKRILEK